MKIKRRDIILIGMVLLIAFLCWLVPYIAGKMEKGEARLRITVNGEEYGTYPLAKDMEIPIGETNTCEIRDGVVSMTKASCPDHLCLSQSKIDADGGTIVCLPNRVVLEIIRTGDSGIPDAVSY